jgi:hypothetical protein
MEYPVRIRDLHVLPKTVNGYNILGAILMSLRNQARKFLAECREHNKNKEHFPLKTGYFLLIAFLSCFLQGSRYLSRKYFLRHSKDFAFK